MALAVGQHAFMPAVAGLLRSAASRSDWHPSGTVVPLYALSNVARSNATRSNYVGTRSFISIDGIVLPPRSTALDPGILIDSLQITDLLNYEANRCTFVAWGFTPKEGQRITVTLGSVNNRARLFAGRILNTEQFYQGKPANLYVSVNAIDDTWGLDARKVSERYTAMTYEAIVKDLLAKYAAPTYTAAVEPGLGGLDEITFTNQDLTSALTQLAKRGGYQWLCDETATIRFFQTDTSGTAPTILNAAHPSLDQFKVQRDLSQVVTRVYVEGGGVNAFAAIAVGETILPVEDAAWYPPSGVVVCGPQRIRYSGKYAGGGGGLVGPGAAPSGAPKLEPAVGAGLSPGPREYAVTFVTASGESVAGSRAAITSGVTAAPPTAPTVSAPTAATGPGLGPDPGVHDYAVTFTTASGETTPGPRATVTTGEAPGPTGYPLPGVPTPGAGVDPGAHEYAVSFVTAIGETLVGPISPQVIAAGEIAPPTSGPTHGYDTPGVGPDAGTHEYAVTFAISGGETTPGPRVAMVPGAMDGPTGPGAAAVSDLSQGFGTMPPGQQYTYKCTAVMAANPSSSSGETALSNPSGVVVTVVYPPQPQFAQPVKVIFPGSLPADATGFYLYRSLHASATYYRVGRQVLPGGDYLFAAGETFYDGATDFQISANPPPVATATVSLILANIPIGPTGVTSRRIYRTVANGAGGSLLFVGTVANNAATTYVDSKRDAALGAAAPTLNSASLGVVPLTAIPTGESGTGVTARKLYRRSGGAGLRLLATLTGNSSTTYTDTKPNASLGAAPPSITTAVWNRFALSAIAKGGALVTGRKLYRTASGLSSLKLLATLADNTTTSYVDVTPDAGLGAVAPAVATATAHQVQLTAIPIGAAAVIARKLFRTQAYGTQLQLLTTLADNVTATWLDAAADAALGANVNTVDTSGLTQPQGNVIAGSVSLQIANIGAFPPEGWAVIGNGQQVIRYHGVSGNVLTGIPPAGPGAISATIAYNSTVTASPQLVGIPASGDGSIRYLILKGDPVNLWVQADNLAAQLALAALMGTDGIIEGYLQDRRLSYTESLARAEAQLALRGELEVGISYTARDVNTRAGRLVTVNLPTQHVVMVDFQLRQVTITRFGIPNLLPTFTASASTDRFSFEALIRAARKDGT